MSSAHRLRQLNDPALWPVIDDVDETAREHAIATLVTEVVKPLVSAIVKRFRRMERSLQFEDLEEISSLVALRFIRKVRAASAYEEHAIQALDAYVTTLTYNALYDFRRQRYPERHRLKRNLRYVMTRVPALAIWKSAENTVAGLSQWTGEPPRPTPADLTRFNATSVMCDRDRPAEALHAIVQRIGHPVLFESLVDIAAELWNVRDAVVDTSEYLPDERQDQLTSIERRQYLETLWREIRQLPPNQRTALLLNLRDSSGSNALRLFLLLDVVSGTELADTLGMTEEQLNQLWEQLPLEDFAIADRLDLSRQQIINLRKAARLRLSRRMSKWK